MKRFLKFDFDARVNGVIIYPAGSAQELEDGPSAQRWIQRGAQEISAKEYKELNAPVKVQTPPPAPPAPPKQPEVKNPPAKDEVKKDADKKEDTDGL